MRTRGLQNRHARAFSYVEGVFAIATLSIATALIVPVFRNGVEEGCRRSKVGTVVRSIVNSVKSFESDYDTPPKVAPPRNEKEQFIFVGDLRAGALHSNAGLFDVLRAIPRGVNASHALNPRQQKYFEESKAIDPANPRDGFVDGKEYPVHLRGMLLDQWGSQFCVVMDTSKRGTIDASSIYIDFPDPIHFGVIAFSLGKDRKLGTGGDRSLRLPKSNAPPEDFVSFQ